jgi:hypothetical protein
VAAVQVGLADGAGGLEQRGAHAPARPESCSRTTSRARSSFVSRRASTWPSPWRRIAPPGATPPLGLDLAVLDAAELARARSRRRDEVESSGVDEDGQRSRSTGRAGRPGRARARPRSASRWAQVFSATARRARPPRPPGAGGAGGARACRPRLARARRRAATASRPRAPRRALGAGPRAARPRAGRRRRAVRVVAAGGRRRVRGGEVERGHGATSARRRRRRHRAPA